MVNSPAIYQEAVVIALKPYISPWQYPLPYICFVILSGPICEFLILEHNPLVFYSEKFPLCPCDQGSSMLALLLVSVYFVFVCLVCFVWFFGRGS